jgi:AcrR family transcriptional regulator
VARTPSARDRLLETSARLFYEAGITATGVDTIAREAGVSKPTLYAQYGSKAELVAAVLTARHERRVEDLAAAEGPLAVFAYLADFYAREEGARGCAFLNAAAELVHDDDARAAVVAEKAWLLERLTTLCNGDERLASQLLLLIDGVAGRVVVNGPSAAAGALADATRAAEALIAA